MGATNGGDGGGWKMIHRRGRGTMNHSTRWEVQKGKGVGRNEEMTNFYFSKFSYSYGAKQMFEIFREYGLIEEVVIPPRRNKNEKIFGFVRFRKVLDARNLEVKLDNIFIKSKKIYVNIPKFQHGRMEAPDGKQNSRDFEHNKGIGGAGSWNHNNKPKNGINMEQKWESKFGNKNNDRKPTFAHLQFDIEKEKLERFRKAFVGVVEDPGVTYNIQKAFYTEDINDNIYRVKLVEDMHGPKRIVIPTKTEINEPDGDDSSFSSDESGGACDQEILEEVQAAGSLGGSGEKYIVDVGGREKDVEEENKCDPALNVRSGLTRTCNDVEMVLESMSGVRAHGYGDKGDLRQNEELGL
ncbi:hypothetical protein KIW84_064523 [Lathyrus oleraceus]|uniref:RRM domain-containing protein n=1 Tax=Pisum sativum TaxID=3888 RepID=A0A9D5A8V0_PEA|nr:hypothetical protein KIW84_064523 [Pisum sativum]